jgi:CubicO group peptidase (beta-lactamase class C family)
MYRILLATLILLAALPGRASSRSDALRSALEPWVKANDFSGIVLVARGDRVDVECFGDADVELRVPMTRTTKMYIGSLSKGFTAYAILQLRDAGRLKLEDRLSRFVPEFPGAAEITIAQLLTHRSGLAQNTTSPAHFEQARRSYTTAEAVGLFANEPRASEPGEREIYANPNYTLLALVIERVSGETFGSYMSAHVFAPLGLQGTAHHETGRRIVPERARGYSPIGMTGLENSRWYDYSIVTGAGSLYSTADDLHNWIRTIAQTPELAEYAWSATERDGRTRHVAGGWDGVGFAATIAWQPEGAVSTVVLANINISGMARTVSDVALALANGQPATIGVPALLQRAPEALAPFVGVYQFGADFYVPNGTMTIVEQDGHLFEARPDGTLAGLIPNGSASFLHRPSWSSVRFEGETLRMFDRFVAKRLPRR